MRLAEWSAVGSKPKRLLMPYSKGCALQRLPIRGGNWNNAANSGVFALNLNNARSNANSNIGFRPALGESQKRRTHGSCDSTPSKGRAFLG